MYEKGYEVYDQVKQLKILCVTWNLGRQKILVKPETMFPNSANADIIVAGFQEAAILNQADVQVRIRQYLRRHDFVVIASSSMWEIMLLVFAKQKHVVNIRDPEIRTYRNGLFGMVGNKGGI